MKKSVGLRSAAAALLGAALLSACTMQGPGNLSVHEALFYGSSQDRVVWVYGSLTGGQGSVSLNGQTLDLRPQVAGALATPGSLSVGGQSVYKTSTTSLLPPVSVVQQGSSYAVRASDAVGATYLVTGGLWYKLSGDLSAGGEVQASAQRVSGLEGAGQLTPQEAAALSAVLAQQGSLVVTVLAPSSLPDAPLKVQPAPSEVQRTGLYLQPLSVITSTTTTSTTPMPAGSPTGASVNQGNLSFREVASGTNAQASNPAVVVAGTQRALDDLWNTAYGRQVPVPPTPLMGNQTAVGIFLGSRPTGGYGVSVQSVRAQGSVLEITVNVRSPGPGTITTQAITSPWTIVAVQGQFSRAEVRDQAGKLLGP